MTPTAIKWLLYDLMRKGVDEAGIADTLKERGASYEDLVAYMVRYRS